MVADHRGDSMTIIKHTDGTVGTYNITNTVTRAALQSANKARKPRPKADKRAYPRFAPLHWSTADYIRAYFDLNGQSHIAAFPNAKHADPMTLYQPLPDRPAPRTRDAVEFETIE